MRYKIEVLCPIHIGTGSSLTPLEFLLDDRFVVFDSQSFFEHNSLRAEQFVSYLEGTAVQELSSVTLAEMLKPEEASDRHYWSYNARLEKVTKDAITSVISRGRAEVKTAIKTPDYRVYIPGTSIKGAIRTALAYYQYKTDDRLFENLVANPWGDRVTNQLFRSNVSRDATYDYLRGLSITDSNACPSDNCLEVVWEDVLSSAIAREGKGKVPNRSDRFKGYSTFCEALIPGSVFFGQLNVDPNVLTSPQSRRLGWKEYQSGLSVDWIIEAVSSFSRDICEWERNYFTRISDVDCRSVTDFYDELSEALTEPKPGQMYLSLGHGSGWHKMTVGLLLENRMSPSDFEKFRRRNRLAAGGRFDRREFQYPKSRKLVMSRENNPQSPFGWVRVTFGVNGELKAVLEEKADKGERKSNTRGEVTP